MAADNDDEDDGRSLEPIVAEYRWSDGDSLFTQGVAALVPVAGPGCRVRRFRSIRDFHLIAASNRNAPTLRQGIGSQSPNEAN